MAEAYPVVETAPGATRQVLATAPELTIVSFRFADGAEGALHSHPHVQATYVASGRFRFTLGDEEREIATGDSLVIPSGVTHGCLCLEAGQLIDSFTPQRDDFL